MLRCEGTARGTAVRDIEVIWLCPMTGDFLKIRSATKEIVHKTGQKGLNKEPEWSKKNGYFYGRVLVGRQPKVILRPTRGCNAAIQ
jgi:hypothetical protein